MLPLLMITFFCLLVSFLANWQKTWDGIKRGLLMFLKLLPLLLWMLALVSVVLFFIPNEKLVNYMGETAGIAGWFTAALLGSVSLIPGFIAYPLCGILIKNGVAYAVIAVFITTLMMVGFVTLPVEARFFGWKTSIVRNGLSLVAALLIGFIMSFFL
jgi:uncharacterized membrane protein YraQ (UPF0718 family)